MTDTGRAPSSSSPATFAVAALHAALFVLGGWIALATSGQFFTGPYEAAPYFPALAVVAIGAIRAAGGAAGARAILIVGDLGVGGLLAAPLVITSADFRALPAPWYLAGAALAVLAAAAALVALPRPHRGRIVRQPRDAALLLALVAVDIAVTAANAIENAPNARMDVVRYLFQVLATTAPFDLAVFGAWWWGSRWPLGLTGAAGIVMGVGYLVNLGGDVVRLAMAFGPYVLATVAGIWGPALQEQTPDARPAAAAVGRSRTSDIWIALGAVAYPFLGLWGHFPIVLDGCLECGPRFPGDTVVFGIGVATLLIVPIVAILALRGGPRPEARRAFLPILIGSAAVVMFEVVAGQAGVARFAFLGFAAPAILLVGLGAAVGLRRPWWLETPGPFAALAAAGLLWVWTWGVRGRFGSASFGEFVFSIVSYGMAVIAALAIARDSSRVGPGATESARPEVEPGPAPDPTVAPA